MHESVLQVRKRDLQPGCQQVRQRRRNIERWRRNRIVKNMDANYSTVAEGSWTLEACDDKTWAVCEKDYGEMEEEDRK